MNAWSNIGSLPKSRVGRKSSESAHFSGGLDGEAEEEEGSGLVHVQDLLCGIPGAGGALLGADALED